MILIIHQYNSISNSSVTFIYALVPQIEIMFDSYINNQSVHLKFGIIIVRIFKKTFPFLNQDVLPMDLYGSLLTSLLIKYGSFDPY